MPAEVLATNFNVEVSWELDQATSSFSIYGLSQLQASQMSSMAFVFSSSTTISWSYKAHQLHRRDEKLTEVKREHLSLKLRGALVSHPFGASYSLRLALVPTGFLRREEDLPFRLEWALGPL